MTHTRRQSPLRRFCFLDTDYGRRGAPQWEDLRRETRTSGLHRQNAQYPVNLRWTVVRGEASQLVFVRYRDGRARVGQSVELLPSSNMVIS